MDRKPRIHERYQPHTAIHSLYSQISGQWKKPQYTFGLRLEYFERKATIDGPAEPFELAMLMLGVSYQLNQPSKKMKLIKSEFGDKEF